MSSMNFEAMESAEMRWVMTNGVTTQTLWQSTQPAFNGYISTPKIGVARQGWGWTIEASGLTLLIRLGTTFVRWNGVRQSWPHYEGTASFLIYLIKL